MGSEKDRERGRSGEEDVSTRSGYLCIKKDEKREKLMGKKFTQISPPWAAATTDSASSACLCPHTAWLATCAMARENEKGER